MQNIVISEPKGSVLILTDLRDTNIGRELLPAMNAASAASKDHAKKTAVLGVTGAKRKLADLLSSLTGQPLKYIDDMEEPNSGWQAKKSSSKVRGKLPRTSI